MWLYSPNDSRKDGSCALHAFHAPVFRLGTSDSPDLASLKAADSMATKFTAGARLFFKQLATKNNGEVARVFGHKSEFLNDFALAYLAQVFNVRIRIFWIFFPKDRNFSLQQQEQVIGPVNALQTIAVAFMDEHYYYLQPQDESSRGYVTLRDQQDVDMIERLGYVTFYNLLWKEFNPNSHTSRGQIFRSVHEWLSTLENGNAPLMTVTLFQDLAYDTSVAANHAVGGNLSTKDLEEMGSGSTGDHLDRFSRRPSKKSTVTLNLVLLLNLNL
jgi:hypothetical protein